MCQKHFLFSSSGAVEPPVNAEYKATSCSLPTLQLGWGGGGGGGGRGGKGVHHYIWRLISEWHSSVNVYVFLLSHISYES